MVGSPAGYEAEMTVVDPSGTRGFLSLEGYIRGNKVQFTRTSLITEHYPTLGQMNGFKVSSYWILLSKKYNSF